MVALSTLPMCVANRLPFQELGGVLDLSRVGHGRERGSAAKAVTTRSSEAHSPMLQKPPWGKPCNNMGDSKGP